MKFVSRSLICVAGLAVAVSTSALPAQAADGAVFSARGAASGDAPSTYLAGYTTTTGGVTKATTKSFTVPNYDCGADTTGILVGILDEPTEGQPIVTADVFLACLSGSPFIITDALVGDVNVQGTAAPGDKIMFTVTKNGGNVTATAKNLTNPAGTATATGSVSLSPNLHFGAGPLYAGGPMLEVPDIGTMKFTKNSTNKGALKKSAATKYDRNNAGKITAGKIKKGTFSLKTV